MRRPSRSALSWNANLSITERPSSGIRETLPARGRGWIGWLQKAGGTPALHTTAFTLPALLTKALRVCVFAVIFLAIRSVSAEEQQLLSASFDDAGLHGWKIAGDLCVAPSFCGGEPFGKYWVAFSTNNDDDPITMCGSNSVAGLETVLRSPNLAFRGKPSRIRVDFKLKFLTNENTDTDLGNDSLIVTVLTSAGPIVVAAFDDSGAAPESKNLVIRGDKSFSDSKCSPTWKYETGMLQVSYYRSFREPFRSLMAAGPIAIEFALNNHFDRDFDSAVIIDDVHLSVSE